MLPCGPCVSDVPPRGMHAHKSVFLTAARSLLAEPKPRGCGVSHGPNAKTGEGMDATRPCP